MIFLIRLNATPKLQYVKQDQMNYSINVMHCTYIMMELNNMGVGNLLNSMDYLDHIWCQITTKMEIRVQKMSPK